jgi:hypothetical protein
LTQQNFCQEKLLIFIFLANNTPYPVEYSQVGDRQLSCPGNTHVGTFRKEPLDILLKKKLGIEKIVREKNCITAVSRPI